MPEMLNFTLNNRKMWQKSNWEMLAAAPSELSWDCLHVWCLLHLSFRIESCARAVEGIPLAVEAEPQCNSHQVLEQSLILNCGKRTHLIAVVHEKRQAGIAPRSCSHSSLSAAMRFQNMQMKPRTWGLGGVRWKGKPRARIKASSVYCWR